MAHLLHIDSSVSDSSVSKELAAHFRELWHLANLDGTVTYRDLGLEPVAHLSAEAVAAGFIPAEYHSEQQKAATAVREELIGELLAADLLLISTPMYNWSVPSALKAWIDHVVVNNRTMTYDGSAGPLSGRPATVVASYGGGYTAGTPREKANHCGPYLETVLDVGLGMDVTTIAAQLTLAPRVPAMASLVPLAEQSKADARAAIAQQVARVSGASLECPVNVIAL